MSNQTFIYPGCPVGGINLGFLSPTGFLFSIMKCPTVDFFVQEVNIPGITIGSPQEPNPFTVIPKPGDHVTFEELSIKFKVDSMATNFFEIYNWIRETGFPENYAERKTIESRSKISGQGLQSDISVIILDASKNPLFECTIKDAMPVALGSLQFSTTPVDINYITAQATFRYTNYTLSKLT